MKKIGKECFKGEEGQLLLSWPRILEICWVVVGLLHSKLYGCSARTIQRCILQKLDGINFDDMSESESDSDDNVSSFVLLFLYGGQETLDIN